MFWQNCHRSHGLLHLATFLAPETSANEAALCVLLRPQQLARLLRQLAQLLKQVMRQGSRQPP